jgi:CHAT domain-containing protein
MTSGLYKLLLCAVLALLAYSELGFAQTKAAIEQALKKEDAVQADKFLQKAITTYYVAGKADSLNDYVFYVGKVAGLSGGDDMGVKAVQRYIQKIKTLLPKPATLRQSYLNAAEYYGVIGKNNMGYLANYEAYRYTLQMPGNTLNEQALIENNLGTYATRLNDLALAAKHYRQAMHKIQQGKKTNYDLLYTSSVSMGNTMWYSSKLDSAQYFFEQAIQALRKTASTPYNKFYRTAIIHNNVSAIYSLQGKQAEAIATMKLCISELSRFVASKGPHLKKTSAVTFQLEATDNLAGMYKETGDYTQAHTLLFYSYHQKKKLLSSTDPAIFISQILIGQLYYAINEYDNAAQYLNNGLTQITKSDGDYLFWQADACATLALVYDKLDNKKQAEQFFEKADRFYEGSLQGNYDNVYLEFLQSAALFYAETKMPGKAMAKALKAYNYTLKVEGTQSLLTFYQMLNMAEVYAALGNYKAALNYSDKALVVVNSIGHSSQNLLDSIRIDLKKPKAILIKEQAVYQLLLQKNVNALSSILNELNKALVILEKRKALITEPKDISMLIADNVALLKFAEKITLDLYKATGNQKYADQLVSLHESSLYNRIRSRLDKAGNIGFAHLPLSVNITETELKRSIAYAFNGNGTHDEKMRTYIRSIDRWNRFLHQLQVRYPAYYKMRYASIFRSLAEIQLGIPDHVTLIRYFFVDDDLMVLVADRKNRRLVKLEKGDVLKQLAILNNKDLKAEQAGNAYLALYEKLWAPIDKSIRSKHVVIIPDGLLYNLNFELLTPQKISSFAELKTKSLLAKYSISYQYSIFLVVQKASTRSIKENFVGFAPGFSDRVKEAYLASRGDSLEVDRSYMNLLPQPFTASVAVKAQQLLGGSLFADDRSTLQTFRKEAGKHKIIHIGTHAEANNQHPELSRLLFAINPREREMNNSLYLYDIYNCDLSSKLTVIAACESGKPGYQDGEGMISLAHAFNYAGSESLITGLWKIDEQASATLMELFYDNLLIGLSKDEALQYAKLTYLSTATGRTLNPQYWAGLVVMGDTAPLVIQKPWYAWRPWGIASLVAAGTLSLLYLLRKKRTA